MNVYEKKEMKSYWIKLKQEKKKKKETRSHREQQIE